MNRNNFGDYIDEICHKCCEHTCHKCENRKDDKEIIEKKQERHNRILDDDLFMFIMVYHKCSPPIDYVKGHFKISQKQYKRFDEILYSYIHGKSTNAIEDVKNYITENRMNLKDTEKYLNLFIKLIYEHNQDNNYIKLNYYPEIKLI